MAARWARLFEPGGTRRDIPDGMRCRPEGGCLRRGVLGGMAGGALGGLAILLCGLGLRLMAGQDGWLVLKLSSFPLLGSAALRWRRAAGA